MNAEREAAIRARLERAASPDDMGLIRRPDLAHLLALVDRQATALDAVRELAERQRRLYGAIGNTATVLVPLIDLRAALAAAEDGGTRGRRSAADRLQGHSGARDGDQGDSTNDHARDNGTTTEGTR